VANAARILDALGDPTRRTIFERVAAEPRSVAELALGFHVSRPAVSQHLKVLKGAGLVTDRQQGTRRIYSADQRGVKALRDYLDQFWDRTLASFQEAAEAEEQAVDALNEEIPE